MCRYFYILQWAVHVFLIHSSSSARLQLVTRGCEALEVTPLRDGVGQPGFLMNEEGFVTELQRFCYAESGGLQLWARVVRLCGHSLVHLSPDERTRLLRTAHKIHITVIPPDENGKPRRWVRLEMEERESLLGEQTQGETGEGPHGYKAYSRKCPSEKVRERRGLVGNQRGATLGSQLTLLLMMACSQCHTSCLTSNQSL